MESSCAQAPQVLYVIFRTIKLARRKKKNQKAPEYRVTEKARRDRSNSVFLKWVGEGRELINNSGGETMLILVIIIVSIVECS